MLDDPALLETFDRSPSSTDMLVESTGVQYRHADVQRLRLFFESLRPDNIFKFIYTLEGMQRLYSPGSSHPGQRSLTSGKLRHAGSDDWDVGSTSLANQPDAHLRKDRDGEYFVSYLMSLRRIDRSSIIDEYITGHKRAVEAWLSHGRMHR
jgi:hypothetical protein